MPLFNDNMPVEATIPTPQPVTPAPIINTASMYANLQHNPKVIGYLDGTPWTTNYYAQYLGEDDPATNSNDIVDPTLKQYLKVNNFELRVITEATLSIDESTGVSLITGSANVYPYITPLVGDIFFALVSEGIYGVFEVTSATRASQFKESAWVIEYSQIDFLTSTIEENYESFKVGELVFDVTKLSYGDNPLLTQTEYDRSIAKNAAIANMIKYYYIKFFSRESDTFILPNDGTYVGKMYDPWLVEYWNTLFAKKEWLDYRTPPVLYDVNFSEVDVHPYTIWDVLVQQNADMLLYACKNMERMSTFNFNIPYQRHSLLVTDINYVVAPIIKLGVTSTDTIVAPNIGNNSTLLAPYLFTLDFYLATTAQTPFELQVQKLIHKQAISYIDIKPLLDSITATDLIVQFYHIPVLLTLLLVSR